MSTSNLEAFLFVLRNVLITTVLTFAIVLGGMRLFNFVKSHAVHAETEAGELDVREYFVATNHEYYEDHSASLGEMAVGLHYFDFDSLVKRLYGKHGEITCTPIECGEGDVIFEYGFTTSCWKVELCTVVENQADSVATYIDLFDLSDDTYSYCSTPEVVEYRLGNYVANMQRETMSGANRMFQIERGAFVDFLRLVEAGTLEQNAVNPLEAGGIPFEKVVGQPTTDFSPAS